MQHLRLRLSIRSSSYFDFSMSLAISPVVRALQYLNLHPRADCLIEPLPLPADQGKKPNYLEIGSTSLELSDLF